MVYVFDISQCPLRRQGLGGGYDNEFGCSVMTPDNDCKEAKYGRCKVRGDYTVCTMYIIYDVMSQKKEAKK